MADLLPLRIDTEPPADLAGSPLVVDARRLALLLCAGVRTVRTWDNCGKLPRPLRIGGRVVWVLDGPSGIRAWLAAGAPDRATWEAGKTASRK